MALIDLIADLQQQAKAQADEILEAARREAQAIEQEAARDISEQFEALLGRKEDESRADARAAVAAARRAAMQDTLEARASLISRVFERAHSLLPEVSVSGDYLDTLGRSLDEALEFVDGDGAEVRCSPGMTRAIGAALKGQKGLTVTEDAEITSGFVVTDKTGSVVVDERLDARLSRMQRALAIDVLGRLPER